jgi:hypothetical protein
MRDAILCLRHTRKGEDSMVKEESGEPIAPKAAFPRYLRDANRIPHITGHDPFVSSHRHASNTVTAARITELEVENLRLQRLVAELLIKNQQLRKRG